jgi:hypothetical protein
MNERVNERADRAGNAKTEEKWTFAYGVSELPHMAIRTPKVV